ncbi:MAG: membrane dipeptidase [Deltaproteobacteria bacterium]|nr:membrane dipeptidase [Deltaproteobacteria bacterium]MDZ4344278.1 membrane dipeptidase [Candidatus Binatia bacterium]
MNGKEIIQRSVVVEGHRDIYEALYHQGLGEQNPIREVVARRLIQCGVDVCVYAVCGDSYSHTNNTGRYVETAYENLDLVRSEVERANDTLKLILTADDVPSAPEPGITRLLLHFEGALPLGGDLSHLRNFHRLGLRSLQLTWNLRNEIGDGIWEERTKGRLTNFGLAVIKDLNRLHMVIDLSHLTPEGFYDALEATEGPLIISHSNASAVYKSPRTIQDEQIKAIASRNGLVGILAIARNVKANGATLKDLVDHLEHMANLVGVDYIGLGLDFTKYDGPRTLKDRHHPNKQLVPIKDFEEIEDLPHLAEELQRRGFKNTEITKILGGNYVRVLRNVL